MTVEIPEKESSKLEVSEIWKFMAAIALSCAISFAGNWITESSKYTTEAQVQGIITAETAVIQNDMKHYESTLGELKTVVKNNNDIMHEIKEELAAMRQERKIRFANE